MRLFILPRALHPGLLAALLLLGGCARTMIPTPYVMYGEAGKAVYRETPAALQTPDIPVIYVTDRAVARTDEHGPRYGHKRDLDLSYGVATVSLGENVDWPTLVEDSTRGHRSRSYHPEVTQVEERGRFGNTLEAYEAFENRLRVKAGAIETYHEQIAGLHTLIDEWLARTDRKEIVVFVHGFNNQFDDAVVRLAQCWHLAGRAGVPIVYSWPAGYGGLMGYAYDRESGEYTIVHLKLLLLALAQHPGVEKIHLVAHSRGTDVATTAVRELHAEVRGALHTSMVGGMLGEPAADAPYTFEVLKLETLVLAAPDMDLDVFNQRFFGENLLRAANRVVVYFSDHDKAIGAADWLFKSRQRLGSMRLSDFKPASQVLLEAAPSIEAINCQTTGSSTHAYLAEHPAALSDLIVLLRTDAPAGDPRRPLIHPIKGVWQLDNDYYKPEDLESENIHLYR